MRFATFVLGLTVPLSALAAPVSEATLEENVEQCVQACTPKAARGPCAELCRCITDAMAREWDEDEFRAHAEALAADRGDRQVLADIDRFADQCSPQ